MLSSVLDCDSGVLCLIDIQYVSLYANLMQLFTLILIGHVESTQYQNCLLYKREQNVHKY